MKDKLTHVEGRIIVAIDHEKKNWHEFEDGTQIRMERRFDNFNMRHVNPVNAIVISSEYIPEGSEIIVHHNCIHDTNKINNYQPLSGKTEASSIRYYSISENEAFAYHDGTEWKPLDGFDFALRIYKPYLGVIDGIEPTLIKQVLWITTGQYKNQACITLQASDYQLIFQDKNNREKNIVRIRTEENKKEQRESEVIAIHNSYTKQVLNNELYIGLTVSDAKPIKKYIHEAVH